MSDANETPQPKPSPPICPILVAGFMSQTFRHTVRKRRAGTSHGASVRNSAPTSTVY